MQQVIKQVLNNSNEYTAKTPKSIRKMKGQFLTPYKVGSFMAELFEIHNKSISILDPGAGTGLLTLALIEKIIKESFVKHISVDLFENDESLLPVLEENLRLIQEFCSQKEVHLIYKIYNENFISYNQDCWTEECEPKYDIIIGNPPYQKLRNDAEEATIMSSIIFGQCNAYFLFLAMSIRLLKASGELVFILPRSFLSGKYFNKFRLWMLNNASISYIHLFKSRYKIFNGEIIQEIIIVKLVKGIQNNHIKISSSESSDDLPNTNNFEAENQVVIDEKTYIRVPLCQSDVDLVKKIDGYPQTLSDFGMKFCTGPIVDFRTKKYIRETSTPSTVPLLWSCNFNETYISWPKHTKKFPQYIEAEEAIKPRLLPNKSYILVKRVLSREGKKRVKVNLYTRQADYDFVGIENHINYLQYPDDISEKVLLGIYALLNSSYYERYIRIISGTNQLNAFELNNIPFPSLPELEKLGDVITKSNVEINSVDPLVSRLLGNL
ncbi:Eco57I restriction-modification methylase domain-containing protein [Desulfotomaculum nigrificans]|uniref:Eco57I restriction-modification methylase domain-containing protein n=1 Tax=Desulfotomaculum nigrificans TaxID=1565 RepID=UPI0001FAE792|nr:Eco57I restriction-modification methylase domain-containing protein [Desulfotomaculum nigrificans]